METRQLYTATKPEYVVEINIKEPTGVDAKPAGLILVWIHNPNFEMMTFRCPLCGYPIDPFGTSYIHADTHEEYWTCKKCKMMSAFTSLENRREFVASYPIIAKEVATLVNDLEEFPVSIRIRRYKSNESYRGVISRVGTVQYKDKLSEARSEVAQEWVEYPADRLERDRASGADLAKLIQAFLEV